MQSLVTGMLASVRTGYTNWTSINSIRGDPSSDSEKKSKDKGEGMEVWAVPLHWGLAQAMLSSEKHAGKTPAVETLAYRMMGRSHSHSRKA